MAYYTEEDLRDFVKYAKEYCSNLKKEDVENEELQKLEELVRILMSMYFNPMVFESYIQGHTSRDYLLSKDLEKLPLFMNEEGLVSTVIVKWRLQRNK